MALFKILKGNEADLPSAKHEGWAYVTEKGNMYVDLSADRRVKIGNRADSAEYADKATGDTKTIRETYLAKIKQVTSNGTTFTFRGETGDGTDAADLITIPLAGDKAGLISNAAQTIKGVKTFNDGVSFPSVTSTTYPAKSVGLTWSGSSDGAKIYYEVQAADKGMLILESTDDTNAGAIFRNSSSGNTVSIINGVVTGAFTGNLNGTANNAIGDNAGKTITSYVYSVTKKSPTVFTVTKGDGTVSDIALEFLPTAGGTVHGELYADSITAGSLVVTGAARFTNGLLGNLTGNVTGNVTGNLTGTATNATKDAAGNIITDYYIHKIIQVTSNGTTFSFRGQSASGDNLDDLITIPAASTSVAGLVTTGAQTWAGTKTFSGGIITRGDSCKQANGYGIDLKNSDIIGANSIYYVDVADSAAEGLHFFVDGTNWNTLWAKSGVLYWSGNHATGGSATTNNIVLHSGNLDTYEDYVTSWAWTNGTTDGPTATMTRKSGDQIAIAAIPSASGTQSGIVTTGGQTFAGDKTFNGNIFLSNRGATGTNQIRGTMGDNDYWRIAGMATSSNTSSMEIATADDGNEPIYVRQYTGVFATVKRTLTLLDASGNTVLPGDLKVHGTISDKESNELKASLFVNTIASKSSTASAFILKGVNTAGDEITALTIPNASESLAGLVTAGDQSFQGTKRFNKALTLGAWSTSIKCATWSRVCYIPCNVNVVGSGYIIQIQATRGNVVYNQTFSVNVSHSQSGCITALSGTNYSPVQVRVIVDSSGNSYFEVYDVAQSATNATTQTVYCRIVGISSGAITKYTSFTDGSAIPSGFTATTLSVDGTRGGLQTKYVTADDIKTGTLKATGTITDKNGNELAAALFVRTIAQKSISTSAYTIKGVNSAGDEITALTLPNATTAQAGLMTAVDQTFAGKKTFTNHTYIKYGIANLYIHSTSTAADSYSIIRLGTSSGENGGYILLNGPSRTNDGGANLMTIRNNFGNLRLNNHTVITNTLTVNQATVQTSNALYVNGTARIKSTNDSPNSQTTTASMIVDGGITVMKQVSAKSVRIDNNDTAKGCTVKFNETGNYIEFVFD